MKNEKPAVERPQAPSPRARNPAAHPLFPFSRLNWRCAGAQLPGFCSEIIVEFANKMGLNPVLYSTERMVGRSPVPIAEILSPYGWRNLCMLIDDRGFIRKNSAFNRNGLRTACVAGKVPYWSDMQGPEMRAVLMRWAIEEDVPELM